MRMRLALTAVSAALITVATSLIIVPLASDDPLAPLATPYAGTSVPGTNVRAAGPESDVDDLVARAYGGCRIWSQHDWPGSAASVMDNGREYRSHGDVWTAAPTIGYAYNVFSNDEIRGDGSLNEVQIIRQAPRAGAPVSESTFYLRYKPTGTADMQSRGLDKAKCR